VERRFDGVRPHTEADSVRAAAAAADDADGLVALGGGSAIDTAKAVSVDRDLPIASIPTTYSGAEWTPFFGVRDPAARVKRGGMGARTEAIVYDEELTLDLPPGPTGGTALNALAHCAEALYVPGATPELDAEALAGAALIARSLPAVLDDGERPRGAPRALLEGAMHAGSALRAGMGLGHAVAQALGGRYGLPARDDERGQPAAGAALQPRRSPRPPLERLDDALGGDAIVRAEELARLAGARRLRDYDVPREDLPELAEATAARPAAKANPRPAPAEAIVELLETIW
jgi:maleylacetate reductase